MCDALSLLSSGRNYTSGNITSSGKAFVYHLFHRVSEGAVFPVINLWVQHAPLSQTEVIVNGSEEEQSPERQQEHPGRHCT